MYQGSGYSHEIKKFFENVAKERTLDKIVHYCGIDNFRDYSLNESHGYKKDDKVEGQSKNVVEWVKYL